MRDELIKLWPEEEEIQACIRQEAEAIDEAVLLAVHQEMTFQRRDVGSGGATFAATEDDLLNEFMIPEPPEGRILLPIVGSSGIGKSHVIRWIEAKLRKRPNSDRLHIIRVPKGSSLKGVLHLLLMGLEGPEFDRLRDVLKTARDHLDPARAARQLQLSVRHRLEQEADAAKTRLASGRGFPGDRDISAFGDRQMLPALLGEPLLEQKHWLTRPDGQAGVLALIAEHVTRTGGHEIDERRHEFCSDDLLLDESINQEDLSSQARRCYRTLLTRSERRREQAAQILNRVLDGAKSDLLELGDNSLVELFGDVRAELYRQGRELVLLVEDFAVLSGLQGALLQVMIAEGVRDGRQQFCTMRTALAYTEGYLVGRDTVLTRAQTEWLIEERPGSDDEITNRIERLVGAYLNAARIGHKKLLNTFSRRDQRGMKDWIPTVDLSSLEPDARSVAEAFGSTPNGYPLFPFCSPAVRQLALQRSVDSKSQLVLNPRYVINNILRPVLKERSAFQRGEFPPAYLGNLRSTEVTEAVKRQAVVRQENLQQYLTMLAVWGDQPGSVEIAGNIRPEIYSAFNLSPLDFGVTSSQPEPVDTTSGSGSQTTIQPEANAGEEQEGKWRKILESWRDGEILQQTEARQLRKRISEAMYAYLPFDPMLLQPRARPRDLIKKVYLPKARGQSGLSSLGAFVVVASDEELDDTGVSASLVEALLAIIRRYEIYGNWSYDKAPGDRGRVRHFLKTRASAAFYYLRMHHFALEVDLVEALVQGLLIGARALGIPGTRARSGDEELIAALFDDPPSPPDGADGPWFEVQQLFRSSRKKWREMLLEQIGARQGGGSGVWGIDAISLVPIVQKVKIDWEFGEVPTPGSEPDYADFVRNFRNIRTQIEKAINEETIMLKKWIENIDAWFGNDIDKLAVQDLLRKLVSQVKQRGLLPGVDYKQLRRELSGLPSISIAETKSAAIRLCNKPSRGEILLTLSGLPYRAVRPTQQFISRIDAFLEQLDRTLNAQETIIGRDVLEDTVKALNDVLDYINKLLTECEEAKQ